MGISSFFPLLFLLSFFHFIQSSSSSTYSYSNETAHFPSALVHSSPIKLSCLMCISLHFLHFFFLSLFHVFSYLHCFSSSFTPPPHLLRTNHCPQCSLLIYVPKCFGPYSWTAWPLNMGPIRCSETSATNYQSSLRKIPEERRYQDFLVFITTDTCFKGMKICWCRI